MLGHVILHWIRFSLLASMLLMGRQSIDEKVEVYYKDVFVTPVGSNGKTIKGLKKTHFKLRVNGIRTKIIYFNEYDVKEEGEIKRNQFYSLTFKSKDKNEVVSVDVRRSTAFLGVHLGEERSIDRRLPEDRQFARPQGISVEPLFSLEEMKELPCVWSVDRFGPTEKTTRFHFFVYGAIESKDIPDKGIEIGMALYSDIGKLLDINQVVVQKEDEIKKLMFYDILNSKQKPAYIRCFARNRTNGKTNSKTIVLKMSKDLGKEFSLSDLCLSNNKNSEVLSIHQIRTQQANGMMDIEVGPYEKLGFVPMVKSEIYQDEKFSFLLEMYDKKLEIEKVNISIALSRNHIPCPVAIADIKSIQVNKYSGIYTGNISQGVLQPGIYQIIIRAKNTMNKKYATTAKTFVVLKRKLK